MGRVKILESTLLVPGEASGTLLVSAQPLSFWGGLDAATGIIIDRRHDLAESCVTGRVLAVPHGRGSSSASGVLLEAICNGTGPVAIIINQVDPIIGLGAILADELHSIVAPVVLVSLGDYAGLRTGDDLAIAATGCLTLSRR